VKKADYARMASFYDRARPLSEQNAELWLQLISRHSRAVGGARVLDLGCGTGRFALPMARRLGFRVTGADSSQEMLAKAREEDTAEEVTWDCQDAAHLEYAETSFDAVFMSHLLHHVESPETVIGECYRVLRALGASLVRYGAMEQIQYDVEHVFFPEVVAVDEARTPTVEMTEQWFRASGFAEVLSVEVAQQTYRIATERLEAAQAKSTSVLTMISQEALGEGLRRLEVHVREQPDDPWLLSDRMTLTVGYKPGRP